MKACIITSGWAYKDGKWFWVLSKHGTEGWHSKKKLLELSSTIQLFDNFSTCFAYINGNKKFTEYEVIGKSVSRPRAFRGLYLPQNDIYLEILTIEFDNYAIFDNKAINSLSLPYRVIGRRMIEGMDLFGSSYSKAMQTLQSNREKKEKELQELFRLRESGIENTYKRYKELSKKYRSAKYLK